MLDDKVISGMAKMTQKMQEAALDPLLEITAAQVRTAFRQAAGLPDDWGATPDLNQPWTEDEHDPPVLQ